MPSLLLHVAAIERLAADPHRLPPAFVHALREDLPYARFGAALPELAALGRFGGAGFLLEPGGEAEFTVAIHKAPVAFGLKLAELVASGALVGSDAGRALLAGYFTHLCVDQALAPIEDARVERSRTAGEDPARARHRIGWAQALAFLREVHGSDLLGHPLMREKLRLLKHPGYPLRGVGGGIYELVRLSALETLGLRVEKRELDRWVRGAVVAGRLLASPVAGAMRGRLGGHGGGPGGFEIGEEVFAALDRARNVIVRVSEYMEKGRFTPKARGRVIAEMPELNPGHPLPSP